MAACVKTDESGTNFYGSNYVFTRFNFAASGDTVKVPCGCLNAAVLSSNGTAPTCAITPGATEDTVTLTGGTPGNGYHLVTRHSGASTQLR